MLFLLYIIEIVFHFCIYIFPFFYEFAKCEKILSKSHFNYNFAHLDILTISRIILFIGKIQYLRIRISEYFVINIVLIVEYYYLSIYTNFDVNY